jgi:hypothetical protein
VTIESQPIEADEAASDIRRGLKSREVAESPIDPELSREDDETVNVDTIESWDTRTADVDTLRLEQINDPALQPYWQMARTGKQAFYIDSDGLLYKKAQVLGEKSSQLCLPECRVEKILEMGHSMPFSGHQGVKRTRDRIGMSFFFPNLKKRVETYVQSCQTCQLHSRSHWTDRSPITPIPRNEPSFGHIVLDCIGPITNIPWPYALVIADLHTRPIGGRQPTH